MRASCVAAVAAASLAAAAPAAAAPPAVHTLLAFLPANDALDTLASQPQLSLGLVSPTLGGYKRPQMAIDISQGARLSARAYTRPLPELRLAVGGGGGRVIGWRDVVRRAHDAAGDVVPGLLASTIERAGGSVAYTGVTGAEDTEALAAADESGRIERFSIGGAPGFGPRVLRLWRSSSLVVARLPAGSEGVAALSYLMRHRRPLELVAVMEAPPAKGLRLLAAGMAGRGMSGGVLHSATTRRDGLIAAPDIAATVLRALGIAVPKKMQGERVDARAGHGASYVRDLRSRLDAILPHRDEAIRIGAIAYAALALLLAAGARRAGLRRAGRIVFLALIWVPALALVSAAISPSKPAEALILALGSLALGMLSDALLPWPAAPALPAAVSFGANTIDLGLGSHLIGLSVTGPNPKGGSRFFGVGNELEIILALTVLVGTGAALTLRPEWSAPRVFALTSVLAALIVGAGRLGADVGGVITFGAGGAAAVVMSLPRGPTPRAIVLAVVVPVLGLAALVALDFAIGGGAHLTRTLSNASGPGSLGKVLLRRWRLSVAGIAHGSTPFSLGVAIVLLVAGVLRRRTLLAPLVGERLQPLRAAAVGGFFAVVAGALANDSGPLIVLIGTACLLLLVGYIRAGFALGGRPDARLTSVGCA